MSNNQTAFVPRRNIVDGVLVVNEAMDLAKREKRSYVVFKVDLEKAYNHVSWNFVKYVLVRMGFSTTWVRWIEGYIFTSSMFALINCNTTKDFNIEKGLRQGDPLSPFLFVLIMEVLTSLMRKAISIGDFQGFKINDEVDVNLLQFVDNIIILAEGDTANLWSMKSILRGFEMM